MRLVKPKLGRLISSIFEVMEKFMIELKAKDVDLVSGAGDTNLGTIGGGLTGAVGGAGSGAAVGFLIGGPAGAAIGAALGFGVGAFGGMLIGHEASK